MHLSNDFAKPTASPEWLVSNGTHTVGPVGTDLLLRGVLHGRVPSGAWVRQPSWQHWREVHKIREVSALQRMIERPIADTPRPVTLRDVGEVIEQASDPAEVLLLALHAAAHVMSATAALAHRVRAPLFEPTISCVFGVPSERLGEVLPWFDPAIAAARKGATCLLAGVAGPGSVAHAMNQRLSSEAPLVGFALVPILLGTELHAAIELGRSDHPFRTSDCAELTLFAEQLSAILRRVQARRS